MRLHGTFTVIDQWKIPSRLIQLHGDTYTIYYFRLVDQEYVIDFSDRVYGSVSHVATYMIDWLKQQCTIVPEWNVDADGRE